jgi:hypothetical protein
MTGMRPVPGCTPTRPAPATRTVEGRPTTPDTRPGPVLLTVACCDAETHRAAAARLIRAAGLERRDTTPPVPSWCGEIVDRRADEPVRAVGGVEVVLVPVLALPARPDTRRPA